MSDVLQLLQGRGKIRVVLAKAFQDKNAMAAAFRTFLFSASPELKDIATKLAIQPEELSDKLHMVMQGAIYTWTEDQVKEKLDDVSGEYRYLEAIGNVFGKVYRSIDAAKKDLLSRLESAGVDFRRNGANNHAPGNISLSFKNASGEALLHRLDLKKICVSTGSACDSKNTQISHVLRAMQLPDEYARGTIRVSLGRNSTHDDINEIAEALISIVNNIRSKKS